MSCLNRALAIMARGHEHHAGESTDEAETLRPCHDLLQAQRGKDHYEKRDRRREDRADRGRRALDAEGLRDLTDPDAEHAQRGCLRQGCGWQPDAPPRNQKQRRHRDREPQRRQGQGRQRFQPELRDGNRQPPHHGQQQHGHDPAKRELRALQRHHGARQDARRVPARGVMEISPSQIQGLPPSVWFSALPLAI